MVQGACLCGTVSYAIDAPFETMLHCHCSMCRKQHGAAFATSVSAPFAAFRWLSGEDAVESYASSEQGRRSFCRHCGSVAPLLLPEGGLAICPSGNLQGDTGIRPQLHMFAGSKAPWYAITDSLPQHEAYPPEFGGGTGVPRPVVRPRPGVTEGSCVCGEVAYEIRGKLLRMYHCHCSRCRCARSAAHTTNLFVSRDGFRWTRGESLVAEYKVPEAQVFAIAFCRRCGGKTARPSLGRDWVVVPAGALDTDPGMRPQAHIYVGSKASWFEITDNLPQFEAAPNG